jgi:ABC-type multidrug transport system fused ATPase/permease subunit
LSTAARAERVIMLVGGRIVEDGSHTQLINAGNQYAKLYSAWLESTSSGNS